jgi:hypothetical protein
MPDDETFPFYPSARRANEPALATENRLLRAEIAAARARIADLEKMVDALTEQALRALGAT